MSRIAHPPPPSAHDPVRSPRGPDVFNGPVAEPGGLAVASRSADRRSRQGARGRGRGGEGRAR
jgi:hypothetical protein